MLRRHGTRHTSKRPTNFSPRCFRTLQVRKHHRAPQAHRPRQLAKAASQNNRSRSLCFCCPAAPAGPAVAWSVGGSSSPGKKAITIVAAAARGRRWSIWWPMSDIEPARFVKDRTNVREAIWDASVVKGGAARQAANCPARKKRRTPAK